MDNYYLLDKFKKSEYTQVGLAEEFGINNKTLNNWLIEKGIDQAINFIVLLYRLKVCPIAFINKFYNTTEYPCSRSEFYVHPCDDNCIDCSKDTDIDLAERFKNSPYKQNGFAKTLDITNKTLRNWLAEKGINQAVNFIVLLHHLNICPVEYLNIYFKTVKYVCVNKLRGNKKHP